MKQLDPRNPIYGNVLADFKAWSHHALIHQPGMVGQSEAHFPSKAAYAVAVFDHKKERFTVIKVMLQDAGRYAWYEMVLRA